MTNYDTYKQLFDEVRAKGGDMAKEYLAYGKKAYCDFSHLAPNFWRALMSHRYILPYHLQSDYVNQEVCDYLALDFLVSYSTGYLNFDDITHICYINYLQALKYDRPTFYLERSLAEALLRTDVPIDLESEDIHWVYPQLRVYLPNNLLSIERNGESSSAMYLDICRGEAQSKHEMKDIFQKELIKIGAHYFPPHVIPLDSFLMNVHMHFNCFESNVEYGFTCPWKESNMKEMITQGNTTDLKTELKSDALDREFLSRAFCLAINILLHMSSLPESQQVAIAKEPQVIRRAKQEGKRHIAGLYSAKIIGIGDLVKTTQLKFKAEPTGKHLAAHWRRGHWRKQAYGTKLGLRRFVWIAPYRTHGGDTPTN